MSEWNLRVALLVLTISRHWTSFQSSFLPSCPFQVLRQYLSCDPNVPPEVMEAVNAPNYPFVDFSTRLVLITFLSYRFLYSNEYKKVVVATGGRLEVSYPWFPLNICVLGLYAPSDLIASWIQHEETCRSCTKSGDMVLCDTCEAAFHLACANLEKKPDEWVCELCEKHKVRCAWVIFCWNFALCR